MMNRKIVHITFTVLVLLALGCEQLSNPFLDDLPPAQTSNLAPQTHLYLNFPVEERIQDVKIWDQDLGDSVVVSDTSWVFGDYRPDTSTSRQILYWWGEDPDGDVVGYQHRWNFQDDWDSTGAEGDTFYLPLQVVYDEFTFQVRAVDEQGAVDPTPATLILPVANAAPELEFAFNSNPTAGADADKEFITFPTRTFSWIASDLDGQETINFIRYALDDTNQWNYLDGGVSSVTLQDIPPGLHTFFAQAIDTAGALSELISFPDSTDDYTPNGWRVIEPVGQVLLVDDYAQDAGAAAAFYNALIDSIWGPGNYTIFETGEDEKAFPTALTDQLAMFNYFEMVFWYHFKEEPHLTDVDAGLRAYLEHGGNAFITSMRMNTEYSFTSMDSTWILDPGGRLQSNLDIFVVDPFSGDTVSTLTTSQQIAERLSCFFPGEAEHEESSDLLMLLEPSRSNWEKWEEYGPIGLLYQPSLAGGRSIFMSIPLHLCNGYGNATEVMAYFVEEIYQ